ncbi:DUF4241 domain-containing protein [Amycolatopsis thermoflava]|uniref:Uncharacterized protein DUF4241 n=1 Tax=Amycolatopsis thermoflava TaxID=84480 RepID=A0A3N2H7A6_9PSEU|nr:DUF4241 domain-containing protein [Amycolatopsis thermoflava]ROS44811.1 uncharacterized protein DUF4241 [Amycolatopsis thermoflava]
MHEIAWTHHFARFWRFDQTGRRDREIEFRLLPDRRLSCLRSTAWHHAEPDQAEFDERHVHHSASAFRPDGTVRTTTRIPGGSTSETIERKPADGLRMPAPPFGEWADFLGRLAGTREHHGPDEPAAPPWRPAVPLRPRHADLLFRPGRWSLPDREVETEVRRAGAVRLTSGRVVAADPGWLDGRVEPFTATVAPGEYPVDLAVVRFAGDPGHERVAAARPAVSAEPVVSWEPALEPGQDPLLLGDGRFYGFSVDAGPGCFVDADALGAMEDILRESVKDTFAGLSGGSAAQVADPASGATLVGFPSGRGDGSFPTWIGRTAGGAIACFVADFLVLRDAEPAPAAAVQ